MIAKMLNAESAKALAALSGRLDNHSLVQKISQGNVSVYDSTFNNLNYVHA